MKDIERQGRTWLPSGAGGVCAVIPHSTVVSGVWALDCKWEKERDIYYGEDADLGEVAGDQDDALCVLYHVCCTFIVSIPSP
jgi:hypothetical protein